MEDIQIIQLFQSRDENAIVQTAEKYGFRLRSISLRITGNKETAEECENDTYWEAWKRIPPSEPHDYFFAFLARIIRALSINRCRKQSSLKRNGFITELTEELESCLPSDTDTETEAEARQIGEAISRYLSTLSDEKQVMFIRRYFYLDAVPQIALRLSVSESKVKTTLFRIRNGLRKYLVQEGLI